MNEADYEQAVATFYEALFAFGFGLTGKEDDAAELTQEAYCRLQEVVDGLLQIWNAYEVAAADRFLAQLLEPALH